VPIISGLDGRQTSVARFSGIYVSETCVSGGDTDIHHTFEHAHFVSRCGVCLTVLTSLSRALLAFVRSLPFLRARLRFVYGLPSRACVVD